MRYSELLEYKRDITINNLGNSIVDRMHNDTGLRDWIATQQPEDSELLNDFFADAENADPTPNKQYTEWIARRYVDNAISRFEDISSTMADFLEEYHTLKVHRKLPQSLADIGRFKTKSQLNDLNYSVSTAYNEFIQDTPEVISKGDAKEIFNNNEVRIIIPNDKEAACYYGQGTQWCTAARNNNMFDSYDWPLFILIPKQPTHEGEKYQVQVSGGDWMDEQDSSVSVNDIIDRFPSVNLQEVFGKYDRDAWYLTDFMPWDKTVKIFDTMLKLIISNEQHIIENYVDTSRGDSAVADFKQLIKDMKGWDAESAAESVTEMMDYQRDIPVDNGGFTMMAYEYPDALGVWIRETTGAGYDLFNYIIDTMTVKLVDNVPTLTHS